VCFSFRRSRQLFFAEFSKGISMDIPRSAFRDITRSHTMESFVPLNLRSTPSNDIRLSSALLTPSPDEEVIKQRGKRNSNIDTSSGNLLSWLHTPTSKPKTPIKCNKSPNMPTRSSPRKRLQMVDLSPSSSPGSSPAKQARIKVQSQLIKRQRISRKVSSQTDLKTAIKGLTQNQLVEMITQLVDKHPELQKEIVSDMPIPDLKPLEERLNVLSRNIFKSFPYTRWGSNRDAFCYRRVSTHLTAFKKECIEQGKYLVSSQQWASVVDYVLLAWSYVNALPDWDNVTHNKLKQQCFSTLASQCMNALKKSGFDREHYEDIQARLIEAQSSSEQIEPCIQKIELMLKKLKC